jgi:alkylhydroperoxidase family enzyme
VPRIEPAAEPYDPHVAKSIAAIMPAGAPPLLLFRTMARSPRVFGKVFAGGLLDRGPLGLREREMVIDRTTARLGCEYEWGVHVALFAARVGFGDEELTALAHGPATSACFAPHEQALLALVDDLALRHAIAEPTWSAARAHFDDAQLLEAIALVGYYHSISFFCNGLELPLEPFAARFP